MERAPTLANNPHDPGWTADRAPLRVRRGRVSAAWRGTRAGNRAASRPACCELDGGHMRSCRRRGYRHCQVGAHRERGRPERAHLPSDDLPLVAVRGLSGARRSLPMTSMRHPVTPAPAASAHDAARQRSSTATDVVRGRRRSVAGGATRSLRRAKGPRRCAPITPTARMGRIRPYIQESCPGCLTLCLKVLYITEHNGYCGQ